MPAKRPARPRKRQHTPVTRKRVAKPKRPTTGKTVKASLVDIGMRIIVPTRGGPTVGTVLKNTIEDRGGRSTVWLLVRTQKGRVDSMWKPNARVRLA